MSDQPLVPVTVVLRCSIQVRVTAMSPQESETDDSEHEWPDLAVLYDAALEKVEAGRGQEQATAWQLAYWETSPSQGDVRFGGRE